MKEEGGPRRQVGWKGKENTGLLSIYYVLGIHIVTVIVKIVYCNLFYSLSYSGSIHKALTVPVAHLPRECCFCFMCLASSSSFKTTSTYILNHLCHTPPVHPSHFYHSDFLIYYYYYFNIRTGRSCL